MARSLRTVAPPVILFDGVCNLCAGAVQWVIAHDRRREFRFASLQSPAGRELIASSRLHPVPDSVVLVDEAGAHTRSDAAIRIAQCLGLPWSLLACGRIVPRFFRDGAYDWLARNRYRWFGKRETCMVPTAELRERFLDDSEGSSNSRAMERDVNA
jgi:predicted DCC family thiol-disulfide oxidoreductase YuxK